jgi:hypothetical protein
MSTPSARNHRLRPRLASVADTLDRELACRNRAPSASSCTWHENHSTLCAAPDVMHDAAWRKGLDEVRRRGLMFELQVFASQMRCRQLVRLRRCDLHPAARRLLEDRSEAAGRSGARA